MTDEEKAKEEEAKKAKGEEGDTVKLSKKEYEDLMGTMTDMKLQIRTLTQTQARRLEKEEEEEEESKPRRRVEEESVDLEDMTKAEFVDYISNHIQSKVGQPLLEMVMTLAVKEEVREAKANYTDFKDYQKEVYAQCKANPNLSIDEAYHIAKSRAPKPSKSEEDKRKEEEEKEKEKGKKRVFGEKGGISPSSVKEGVKLSSREAAEKALEEIED